MSARIAAAIRRLRLKPGNTVLEIGCGHGVAIDLICREHPKVSVVAIDRSAKMIEAATRRNAEHIAAGRVRLHCVELESFDPKGAKFDAVLALRVALFDQEPARAEALVRRWLKRGGRVVAAYDRPAKPMVSTNE